METSSPFPCTLRLNNIGVPTDYLLDHTLRRNKSTFFMYLNVCLAMHISVLRIH